MLQGLLLAAAALIPAFLLVIYFHRRDVYPEPPKVLWTTFGLGILIIFPVLALAFPLDWIASQMTNPLLYGFASAFLGAAIPEELFKFVVVQGYAARHMECDEPMDGLVYGATASLGFAALENVLYVTQGGLEVAVMRAVLSVPGHAFLGAIMGYYVGQAKFSSKPRGPLLWKALLIPTVLHGFYNAPLLATARLDDPTGSVTGCVVMLLLPLAPAIVLGEAIWAIRLLHQLRADQLAGRGPYLPKGMAPGSAPADWPATVPAGAPPLAHAAPPTPMAPPPAPLAPPPGQGEPGAPATPTASPGRRLMGWLGTLVGGAMVCGGGIVTVAVLVALLFSEMAPEDRFFTGVGGLLLGPLPLIIGAVLFALGIRWLNRND